MIHFSVNESPDLKQLQVPECDHKGKYLDLSFCKGKSQVQAFARVVEKM